MRPLYIDINGTTDASGNASIPVAMPRMTGRWHNAKFTLGTTAPAEWAILVNGRPYTYGRGRRVTLGPELIQDGETATVSVIGGPPKVTIDGTCTGVSGTPDEILASYSPQPNTIALDTATPHQALQPVTVATKLATPSFTVNSGQLSGAQIFTISPGTIAVRVMVTANGLLFAYSLLILGRQSNVQYFGQVGAPGSSAVVPSPTLPITIPVESDWDTQVEIHVENPTQNVSVFVSALTDVEAPGQAGAAQSVAIPTPALWQSFPLSARVDVNAVAADTQVIAGAAGQTVALGVAHFFSSAATRLMLKDGSGGTVKYVIVYPAANAAPIIVPLNGMQLTAGNGLFINTTLGNEMEFSTTYSQG